MKSTLLFTGMAVFSCSILAQDKISEYDLSIYKDKVFEVQAVEPEASGEFSFYIDVPPAKDTRAVSLIVDRKKLQDFINNMETAKALYSEWKAAAIANGVQDVSKEIKTEKLKLKAAFIYGSGWHFDFNVTPMWEFRVLEGKQYLIVSNRNKLLASDNRYIDSNGFLLIFSDETEIDNFLSKLSENSVIEYFASKKSQEDIFKQ